MNQTAIDCFVEEFFNHSRISTFHTGEQEEVITLRQFDEVVEKTKAIEKERMVDFAYKYGNLTLCQIADAFDNEYTNKK
jgi:hypothetical protein